jgi:hypothetical protein
MRQVANGILVVIVVVALVIVVVVVFVVLVVVVDVLVIVAVVVVDVIVSAYNRRADVAAHRAQSVLIFLILYKLETNGGRCFSRTLS